MDIKNFFLKQKWIGALCLILACLVTSFHTGDQISDLIKEVSPIIEKEASAFLPVTFENGMIVKPENTIIERTHQLNGKTYRFVLDTRTDYFEPQLFKDKGIYVSRAALYSYGTDIRVKTFENVPNMVIDQEILEQGINWLKTGFKPIVVGILFASALLGALICVGINTLLFHWLMKKMYGAKLSQTIRLNTYAYIVCTFFGLGFLVTLIISLGVNFIVASLGK